MIKSLNTPSFCMLYVNHRAFPESCLEIGEIGVILDRCGRFLIIDPNGLNPVCQKTTFLEKAF